MLERFLQRSSSLIHSAVRAIDDGQRSRKFPKTQKSRRASFDHQFHELQPSPHALLLPSLGAPLPAQLMQQRMQTVHLGGGVASGLQCRRWLSFSQARCKMSWQGPCCFQRKKALRELVLRVSFDLGKLLLQMMIFFSASSALHSRFAKATVQPSGREVPVWLQRGCRRGIVCCWFVVPGRIEAGFVVQRVMQQKP